MLEKTLESPLDCKVNKPVNLKRNQSWIFTGRTDAEAEAPIGCPPDVKNRLTGKDLAWCWKELKTGGEGDDSGWDDWMASLTQAWIWASFGSRWWTGKPDVLHFMGFQRVGPDWGTDKRRLYTWTSPEGQHRNQIDYILCSQRWRSYILSAKTRPGADYGSEQELLIAKFRLKLKKVGKTTRPFRYDLNQMPYDYTVEVRYRFKGLGLIDRFAWWCQTSLVAQRVKPLPAMRETWVRSLGWEDPVEKEMATHSSILAWRIPRTEEPGGLQCMVSQRVRHD